MRAGWWLWISMLGCGGPAEPPPVELSALGSAHDAALAAGVRVRDQLDCEASVVRYLCPAAQLPGVPIEPAAVSGAWLGLTVALRNSRTVEANALETAGVSVLRGDGEGVSLVSLRPSDDDEVAELTSLASNLSLVLKGRSERVYVSAGLADYLRNAPFESSPLQSDAHGVGFVASHPARIYKVDAGASPAGARDVPTRAAPPHPAAWVVVEQGAGGTFLSVFPDVSLTDAPEGRQASDAGSGEPARSGGSD